MLNIKTNHISEDLRSCPCRKHLHGKLEIHEANAGPLVFRVTVYDDSRISGYYQHQLYADSSLFVRGDTTQGIFAELEAHARRSWPTEYFELTD